MWTIVEWYGIFVVSILAVLGSSLDAITTFKFEEFTTDFQNEYQYWYDIIVSGILM